MGCENVGKITEETFDEYYPDLSEKCKNLTALTYFLIRDVSQRVLDQINNSDNPITNARFFYNMTSTPSQDDITVTLRAKFTENTGPWSFEFDDEGRVDDVNVEFSEQAFFWARYFVEHRAHYSQDMSMETHVAVSYTNSVSQVVRGIVREFQSVTEDL